MYIAYTIPFRRYIDFENKPEFNKKSIGRLKIILIGCITKNNGTAVFEV